MPDPLDPRLVYAKTPAGLAEVQKRSLELEPAARRVLLLVDGRRPVALLPDRVRSGEMPKLIEQLLAAGLITLSGIVEELPPGWTEARDPQLAHFKKTLHGVIERELGPAGRVLEARVQDCVNMTVMRSVLREIVELVRVRKDGAAAERVAESAQAAHRTWAERSAADRGRHV